MAQLLAVLGIAAVASCAVLLRAQRRRPAAPGKWATAALAHCDALYAEDSPWRHVRPALVSITNNAADAIMQEVGQALQAGRVAWTHDRHKNYPTRDIPVAEATLPVTYAKTRDILKALGPVFEARYAHVRAHDLTLKEAFVVKYGAAQGDQDSLAVHHDGCDLSFVCALNDVDEYEGGGTVFPELGATVKARKGQCCVFAGGQQYHGGVAVTAGERYLLTGFVYNGPSVEECNALRAAFVPPEHDQKQT